MELPSVEETVTYLLDKGFWANVGNPGQVMPHLSRPVVAVNLQEGTQYTRTMVAHVCGPQAQGQSACEYIASKVAQIWTSYGASCRWGDYGFDGKCAMHTIKVYGTWDNTPAEE